LYFIAAMKFLIILFLNCCLFSIQCLAQVISISDARALPIGSTVTVNGQVTSGSEFGTIRYMQDGTAGIAIFSAAVGSFQRGDNVTVTGVTTEYQNLLEISPVNTWTINSSQNPDPQALQITPSQLGESNESMLVRINNVTFSATGNFSGGTTYNFTSSGQSGVVYLRSGHPLAGQPIPTGNVILYGINSQYGNVYQVLPRGTGDLVPSSVISITTVPYPENITTTSFTLRWNTSMNGNAFVKYGLTPALELGVINGPSNTSSPGVNISGLSPATVYYAQAFSVSGSDTALSAIKPHITASNSSGLVKVYFNREVSNSVASPPGNQAINLPGAFDDTLKAYIDRSILTLDIAIYSFDNSGTSLIVQAINDAYNRGVQVRVVTDGGNVNAGLQNLNPAIPVLPSPTSSPFYYGIMHNKFFIIDALHPDPNRPVVMTGSTNWSNNQLNSDRNNLVFIQDQSLAKVYKIEFEEMWGGSGAQPNLSASKFGPDKSDNTPHILNVGGKRVDCHFSPTDNTNSRIMRAIESADSEMYFATMVYTRNDLAYAMEQRYGNFGVYGAGIVNDSSGLTGVSFQIIQSVIGNNMMLYSHATQTGIMHHKYMIADQGNASSDPLVLTGSHNWSSAADQRNDENTLVIYDQLIANQFYQEFHYLFNSNGGALSIQESSYPSLKATVYPNPSSGIFNVEFTEMKSGPVTWTLFDMQGRVAGNGTWQISEFQNSFEVNGTAFSKGIYLFKISAGTSHSVFRISVH
jgi:hypothetical protein